jgi:hypothetical protein
MRSVTEDVLNFLDTNEIPEQWISNDIGSKKEIINPDFVDELDLQEQINETEIDGYNIDGLNNNK